MTDKDNTAATKRFEENAKNYAKILSKCWSDDAFLANFKANPLAVLQEHNIKPPKKKTITVVQDTEDTLHLVIPPKPTGLEQLSENDLETAAGGYCGCGGCARSAGCARCAGGVYHPVATGVVVGAALSDDDDDW